MYSDYVETGKTVLQLTAVQMALFNTLKTFLFLVRIHHLSIIRAARLLCLKKHKNGSF